MKRRSFLLGAASSLAMCAASPALAGFRHGIITTTPPGKTLIGGFDENGQSFAFINFLKLANNQQTRGGYAYPGILDNNGYPTSAPSTAITMSFVIPLGSIYSGNYVLKQRGVSRFNVLRAPTGTWGNINITTPGTSFRVVSDYNSNVISNSRTNITVAGANPRVVFTLNGLPNTGNGNTLAFTFLTTGPVYTTPDIVFCRADQEALLDGGAIFNPDFITLLKALNPKILRTMDWSSVNQTISSQFGYRAPTTALSYRTSRWQPSAWVGSISASGNNFTSSAPSDWSSLSDGVMLQGQFASALGGLVTFTAAANNGGAIQLTVSGGTAGMTTGQKIGVDATTGGFNGGGVWTITVDDASHITLQGSTWNAVQGTFTGTISTSTLTVGTNSAKVIASAAGAPISGAPGSTTSFIATNTLVTMMYDSVVDCFFTVPRGIGNSDPLGAVPIEIQVALANTLGCHLWSNLPFQYTNSSISSHATVVANALSPGLNCYYELSNEVWNNGFTQFSFAFFRGQALGFPTANAQNFSYHGLRSRMMFGQIEAAYAAVGKTNYKRVIANQAFGGTAAVKAYKLGGADLAPSGTHTGTGNATYNTFTGSADYTQFPNRPVDHCDSISYATYYLGAVLTDGTYAASGTYTGMTGAADDYASGDPTRMASALSWVDTDLRSGTSTITNYTVQTIGALNTSIYPAWETLAAFYDGAGRPSGTANLTVDNYEGGCASLAPTTSQCTTIGISTSYGGPAGTVNTLLTAYKNNNLFQQLVHDQYTQMLAQPHSATPAWFALQGASQWSQLPGNTYTGPTSLGAGFLGTPFKSWDGTVAFNH